MQTLQQQQQQQPQAFKIEETERKGRLLEIVSDKYCRSIMESIMHKPKSVIEITSDTNILMSTVYRRVQNLHDNKLLHISGIITDEGKRLFMYKSKIRGMKSTFDNGHIEVELIPNN